MKNDTVKTFKTNEKLYNSFALRCKSEGVKIYERINELIVNDLEKPLPSARVESEQPLLLEEPNA